MTVPNGYVKFNADTGSDTLASGLGPSTPLNGSAASTTASSAVVTGIDTTAVTVGDLLWVQSSSGRQFSIIASVDSATQVTCDDTFDNTESGRTWAIGGKRATLDDASSRRLTSGDMGRTWIELETDQTITSGLGVAGEYARIKSSGSTKKTITISGAGEYMFVDGIFNLKDIRMIATDNNVFAVSSGNQTLKLKLTDCIVGDETYPFSFFCAGSYSGRYDLYSTTFINIISATNRFSDYASFYYATIDNCIFKHCGNLYAYTYGSSNFIRDSIFIGPDSVSIDAIYAKSQLYDIRNCIFYNYNAVCGISNGNIYLNNCIFHTLSSVTSVDAYGYYSDNYYYNVSNANGSTVWTISNELIQLTEDPFVDVANYDFNLNDKAGGGAVLKAAKYEL